MHAKRYVTNDSTPSPHYGEYTSDNACTSFQLQALGGFQNPGAKD